MFFDAMRVLGLVAASAVVALAGARQASLQGVETGHFITNPGTQGATVITDDFAEGIAPRLGKYTLIAREEINLQTGDVSDGAFVITAADGTIRAPTAGALRSGPRVHPGSPTGQSLAAPGGSLEQPERFI